MDTFRKILIGSLIIAWVSVLLKYETFAFLSRSSDQKSQSSNSRSSGSQNRVREAIREKYHRVVDKPSSDTNSNNRISQGVREAYHRVADKIHKPDKKLEINKIDDPKPQPVPVPQPKPNPSPNQPANNYPKQPGYNNPNQPANNYPVQPGYNNPNQPANNYPVQPGYNNPGYNYPNQPYPNQPAYNYPNQPGYQNPPYQYPPASGQKSNGYSKIKSLAKKIIAYKMAHGSKHRTGGHNYASGMYYDYNYRPGSYAGIKNSLCKNYLEYEGIVLGEFYCPIEGFDSSAFYCCGPTKEQYCCTKSESLQEEEQYDSGYNNRDRRQNDTVFYVFLFVAIFGSFLACIGCGVCIFFCYKKKIYHKIPGMDSGSN